ncbi:MFS transporter [Paenibacillus swuensis]|uniref:MFS transporter n=1 Tax=Paenibacillus swuensis TaxID=1178515 RepID=A0A172TDT0_9BACL|nr:MFS transporter [Paenibacillus swuensis]ANE45067.1 MFS transporter [Paenibacillus swuensis]
MKTAVWLYFFMFVAFFDLHAQYPILTPFAISIGAAPSFIGLIMGMYSLTHLPGNLIAGFSVDRYGSKRFIILSLLFGGVLMLLQAHVTDPWQLLAVRSVSGFVLAFLSPACLAMLAKMARDHIHQGKLMAGNGLIHTFASVFSPAAGAYLVAQFGFTASFQVLGCLLIATGLFAIFGIKSTSAVVAEQALAVSNDDEPGVVRPKGKLMMPEPTASPVPWLFYGLPLAISCSQGILFFELPLLARNSGEAGIMNTGILFSLVSLGALITLSLLFLNRLSPFIRTASGSLALSLIFFGMASEWPLPLAGSLVLIGMAKGIIFPALASLLLSLSGGVRYGRVFSLLSVAFSIGAFLGPLIAGHYRDEISPYFVAFLVLILALTVFPVYMIRTFGLMKTE